MSNDKKQTPASQGKLPRVGSKLWTWTKDEDDEVDETYVLETPVAGYEMKVDCGGDAVVTYYDNHGEDHEWATFSLFRFGSPSDYGRTLDEAQTKKAIRHVQRLIELDARLTFRALQEAEAAKKPEGA